MKKLGSHARFLFVLLLILAGLGLAGCATTGDSDNLSERPWDSPKGWENGLPSTMSEGR
jgi:hypothetical protein